MVLEHHLHGIQDRAGFGLKLAEASGDLPKGRDPGTAEANDGNDGGRVHGQQIYTLAG